MRFKTATELLEDAIAAGVCSAAQVVVTRNGQTLLDRALGRTRQGENGQIVNESTLFDLASLTKPLVTAAAAALLVDAGDLDMNAPLSAYLKEYSSGDKAAIRVRHLLQHTSGLPAWKPYFEQIDSAREPRERLFELIDAEKLQHAPGERAVYSDLDFILLGRLIENITNKRLDTVARERLFSSDDLADLRFLPIGDTEADAVRSTRPIAASEDCPRRGLLIGEVHDDNAHAGGGVFGHAGLFGTARAVATALERWRMALLDGGFVSAKTARRFVFPQDTPRGCSFVLGWDRPTWKGSLGGRYLSPHSIGHLGFTGTSAWLDHDRAIGVVLLTNRVHPSREEDRIGSLRRALHDAVFEELNATGPGPYKPPPAPENTKRVHLIGVAGTAMGSLAGMLKAKGLRVTGSDQAVYPPMSDVLAEQQIEIRQPFSPENLADDPDLTVVGNVCTRDHIEVVELKRRGLAYDSMAGTLERLFLSDKKPLVMAGTHGKTTTSSLAAWMLHYGGYDPGFMIGGLLQNFNANYQLGTGEYFVVEGDEYDTAYFDKFPKFMHYRPYGAVLTSIEFDHADIFDTLEEIEAHFKRFAELIPKDGALAACWDHATVRKAVEGARCQVLSYGQHAGAEWRAENIEQRTGATTFTLTHKGEALADIMLPMGGRHNIDNALGAMALLVTLGYPPEKLALALAGFQGVARRQQIRGVVGGVRVIDDFAHHPTAIKTTLEGLKQSYPGGRLLAVFDPRTNTTSRNIFQKELSECFDAADLVIIGPPSRQDRIPQDERLDAVRLATDITSRKTEAFYIEDVEKIVERLVERAEPGDTIAVLSNGGFGGIHDLLLAGLKARD